MNNADRSVASTYENVESNVQQKLSPTNSKNFQGNVDKMPTLGEGQTMPIVAPHQFMAVPVEKKDWNPNYNIYTDKLVVTVKSSEDGVNINPKLSDQSDSSILGICSCCCSSKSRNKIL